MVEHSQAKHVDSSKAMIHSGVFHVYVSNFANMRSDEQIANCIAHAEHWFYLLLNGLAKLVLSYFLFRSQSCTTQT